MQAQNYCNANCHKLYTLLYAHSAQWKWYVRFELENNREKKCEIGCVKNCESNFITMKNVLPSTRYLFSIAVVTPSKSSLVHSLYKWIYLRPYFQERISILVFFPLFSPFIFTYSVVYSNECKNQTQSWLMGYFHCQRKFKQSKMNHTSNMVWVLFILNWRPSLRTMTVDVGLKLEISLHFI